MIIDFDQFIPVVSPALIYRGGAKITSSPPSEIGPIDPHPLMGECD